MNLKEVLKNIISRFEAKEIDVVLSGGLALSTMNIYRFTKDIDFLVNEKSREDVQNIMIDIGYELQDFSNEEILSFFHPLKIFGQVDFLLARRKYTKSMMQRALIKEIFDGEFQIKTIRIEDLIGLKLQAMCNDPKNRYVIDAPDIQRLLSIHKDNLDIELIKEYFGLFQKGKLLDEWLNKIK